MITIRYHIAAILICFALAATGQDNSTLFFSSQHQLSGAALAPASFGNEDASFWFNLPSFHVRGNADFLTRGQLVEILNGGDIPSALMDDIIGNLNSSNSMYAAADIMPLAFGYKIKKSDKELFSVNLTWTEKVYASSIFGPNFLRLLWDGNRQFAGQTVDLGPIEGRGIYHREIGIGAGIPVFKADSISVRAGFRAKYHFGLAGATGALLVSDLFTAADGSSISYNVQGEINSAGLNNFDAFSGKGKGFSFDLGLSAELLSRYQVDVSVLDIGGISFNKDTELQLLAANQEFGGVLVDNVFSEVETTGVDSLENYFDIQSTENAPFSVSLGTRIAVRVGYFIPATSKNGREYNKHAVYLGYIQGLQNTFGSTTSPNIRGTYVYNVASILELGASVGYSYDDIDLGAFLSARGGPFRFALGSGDFAGLLFNGSNTGADITMLMSFAF